MLKSSAKIASFSQFMLQLIENVQHDEFVLSVVSHTGNYAHGKFKIILPLVSFIQNNTVIDCFERNLVHRDWAF